MTNKKKKSEVTTGNDEQSIDLENPGNDEQLTDLENQIDVVDEFNASDEETNEEAFAEIEREIEEDLLKAEAVGQSDEFAALPPEEPMQNFSEQGQSFHEKWELIKSRLSSLLEAENRKKLVAVLGIVVVSTVLAYSWIFSGDSPKNTEDKSQGQDFGNKINVVPGMSSAPVVVASNNDEIPQQRNNSPSLEEKSSLQVPVLGSLDTSKNTPPPPPKAMEAPPAPQRPVMPMNPPKIDKPVPPAPVIRAPVIAQSATASSSVTNIVSEEEKRKINERMRSSVMVYGGGGFMGASGKETPKDPQSLGFRVGEGEDQMLKESSRAKEIATKISNLDRTIIQGKLINAILETAINTTLPGMLRAIVSRDIYAEQSKNILIPKGSRLIGSYASGVGQGQTRIEVVWERLVTPRGIDLKITAPGSDNLGRNGISGIYNDMWINKLTNALLVSYIIPRIATEISDSAKDTITVTQNQSSDSKGTNGLTTTETGTANAFILRDSINKFQETTKKLVEERMMTKPLITVDQGEAITVLVAKDLLFPEAAVDSRR